MLTTTRYRGICRIYGKGGALCQTSDNTEDACRRIFLIEMCHSGISCTPKEWSGSLIVQGDDWLSELEGIVCCQTMKERSGSLTLKEWCGL